MIKILTLTMNPAIDKSAGVKQIEPDKKLRCQEPVFTPGGGGDLAPEICANGFVV